ncbi:hypothetical protein Bca101_061960 [Brassica carinata]
MEYQKQTSFTFEIDNFSDKEALIRSPNFFCGGCEWFVDVYPKGYGSEDHLSAFLCVANPESLLLGWKRRAILSLVLLNESGKRLYSNIDGQPCKTFCARFPEWGWADAMPLEKLQENGFMEKNKLIVQVKVQVIEVVDEANVTGKETLDVNGFQVLYCQVGQVTSIFTKHPDIALNFIPKSQLVKTTYMNLLMGLIEKLNKPPRSFTKNELSDTRMLLMDLTKAGFKLEWLKEKLDEISLEWKKANDDGSLSYYGSRVQELDEQVKNLNLELDTEKVKSAAKVLSLEQTVSDLRDELSMEIGRSTPKDVLVGVVGSWEVLDYPDLKSISVSDRLFTTDTMFPGEGRWYFSREEIENNSPSRGDGIDSKEETRLRKSYCSFLRDLGSRFNLHQATIATAMVFCHRFFLRQSHAKNDRWTIAALCLFISAKIESTRLSLKTLIIASNEILHEKVIAAEQKQEVFEQYKELYLSGEKLVLTTLNFDLNVDLPYDILIKAMQKYILDESTQAEFPSVAWKFVQDSLWTTLWLQYQPRQIAGGAFFLTAKHIKMDVQSNGARWCQEFGITPDQINDIRRQMSELYHEKKRIPASTGSIGETSNSGDVVQPPVPADKCPTSETEGGSSSVADGSVQDKSRPEGVEKDSPDRDAGDSQEDSCAPTNGGGGVKMTEVGESSQGPVAGNTLPRTNDPVVSPPALGLTIGCVGVADPGPKAMTNQDQKSSSDCSGDDGGF